VWHKIFEVEYVGFPSNSSEFPKASNYPVKRANLENLGTLSNAKEKIFAYMNKLSLISYFLRE